MRFIALLLAASTACSGALTPEQKASNLESFEFVWTTIRDKHWDSSLDGPKWRALHDQFKPKVEQAADQQSARAAINEMIQQLHLTHFGVVPGEVYSELHAGAAGLDTRILGGKAVVVKGPHRGWMVQGVADTIAKVSTAYQHSTMRELMTVRAVSAAAGGLKVTLSDGRGQTAPVGSFELTPRGEPATFGNLPTQYVWIDSRQIGRAGYFAFNLFLDPGRLIPELSAAVAACESCSGFVMDLRGNTGGIGAMAMGMAGFFVNDAGQVLGTMQLRDSSLKFAINPRAPHFTRKLAVLVDGLSASTSEIFAGGLQDLGRARIFGSRTAGAALPSVIERLPNGDAFQYAIANYVSTGGAVLEGKGVTPDEAVSPTRQGLLAGKDEVLERALQWIQRVQ